MREPATRHRHPDGTTHSHSTVLSPPVVELLQQLEDFTAGLQPQAAAALRRLLKSGLLAEADGAAGAGGDRSGYRHAWYRTFLATHHEHPPTAGGVTEGEIYAYLPPWWPPIAGRSDSVSR